MRIVFLDSVGFDFDINTPQAKPLGGAQSALSYLIRALKNQDQDVWLFSDTKIIKFIDNIPQFSRQLLTKEFIQHLSPDICIIVTNASKKLIEKTRELLPAKTQLILWAHHDTDQPSVSSLTESATTSLCDGFIFISQWQKSKYLQDFKIPEYKTIVLKNAISPWFENLFESDTSVVGTKALAPSLAYTSTPYRGLNLLIELYPKIQKQIKDCRLNVFSDMKVYGQDDQTDQNKYGDLYQQCRQTEGVNYIGSIPQPELAKALKRISFLTYPNTFPETSCIAIMEAMAAGCHIITSDLGALRETTAGFADLIPIDSDQESYQQQFTAKVIERLQQWNNPEARQALDEQLQAQVNYVNQHYTWKQRAQEWITYLESLCQERINLAAQPDDYITQVENYIHHQHYQDAIQLCELATASHPDYYAFYGYWGVALVLLNDETTAQLLWATTLAEIASDSYDQAMQQLIKVLQREADFQVQKKQLEIAYALHRYVDEIQPDNLLSTIELLHLAFELGFVHPEFTDHLAQATEVLHQALEITPDLENRLQSFLTGLLDKHYPNPQTLSFLHACMRHRQLFPKLIDSLIFLVDKRPANEMIQYGDAVLQLAGQQWNAYYKIGLIYRNGGDFERAVAAFKTLVELSQTLPEKVNAYFRYLSSYLAFGTHVEEANEIYAKLEELISDLLRTPEPNITCDDAGKLIITHYYLAHFLDQPHIVRPQVNQLASLTYPCVKNYFPDKVFDHAQQRWQSGKTEKVRIGILSNSLRYHPVGFQSQALFQFLDREKYEIYVYFVGYSAADQDLDPLHLWIRAAANQYHLVSNFVPDIAQQIYDDQIGILIDLDSSTSDTISFVLALKPAPIQMTWIGFDATGLPTVDYFITDPYILPDDAQPYYQEKLWRLPHVYVALDYMEVGTATIRREDLNISESAIVYMCAQRSSKFHPDVIRLQSQILRCVENSYLLIKYWLGGAEFERFCLDILEQENIPTERVRFLQKEPYRIHRANLGMVDVVLDTFPYVGGTTTLEALWMEIPVVTLVGQQFVSRHSYSFMMNAGVSEGIAWTHQDYVDWGIRLGSDEQLRQQISWKLKQAKRQAPIWDGRQFTQEMDAAFQAMWEYYQTDILKLPEGHRLG